MTSNNLEAVELIIEVQSRLLSGATWGLIKPLDKALKLLQADEDIEVKEQASRCICNDCPIHGKTTPYEKPTKETKLNAIKERLQLMDSPRPEVLYLRDEVIRITNVLMEEE